MLIQIIIYYPRYTLATLFNTHLQVCIGNLHVDIHCCNFSSIPLPLLPLFSMISLLCHDRKHSNRKPPLHYSLWYCLYTCKEIWNNAVNGGMVLVYWHTL